MKQLSKVVTIHLAVILLLLLATLCIALAYTPIRAQEEEDLISTTFEVGCIEALSEDHYRIRVVVTSNGVEDFTFQMGDIVGSNPDTLPYSGNATTNIPDRFTTAIGVYGGWYLDAHSEDSPYTFNLLFTNDIGIAGLPVNTWDNAIWCDDISLQHPTVVINLTVETAPDCPAVWLYPQPYCYTPRADGVIPLPLPPSENS